jgi:hypothetical protein
VADLMDCISISPTSRLRLPPSLQDYYLSLFTRQDHFLDVCRPLTGSFAQAVTFSFLDANFGKTKNDWCPGQAPNYCGVCEKKN